MIMSGPSGIFFVFINSESTDEGLKLHLQNPLTFAIFSGLGASHRSCPYSGGGCTKVWVSGGRNPGSRLRIQVVCYKSVKIGVVCLSLLQMS